MMRSIEELAADIRKSTEWVQEDVEELIKAAGMEDGYRSAELDGAGGGRTAEDVIFAAADALGVEIL